MLPLAEARRSQADLRRRLVARDWQEIVTFSFVSAASDTTCLVAESKPVL